LELSRSALDWRARHREYAIMCAMGEETVLHLDDAVA
jgi:hypothetical protein